MKQAILGTLAFLGFAVVAPAQTINVAFSHFWGKQYVYVLEKGAKKDTIATGKLDAEGKAVLVLPAAKKDYAGISHFILTDGGGIDFIVNKEPFLISSTEENPNYENIKFTVSPDNDFLNERKKKLDPIVNKASLMQYGLKVYKKEDALYPVFDKEQENLNQQLTAVKTATAKSPLYAARLAEIYDVLNGVGSNFKLSELEKAKETNLFIRDRLDMAVLYTSGQWSNLIEGWAYLHQSVLKDDVALLADIKQVMSRIKSNDIYTAFTEKAIQALAKVGKDQMIGELSEYASKSGRLQNTEKSLVNSMNGPAIGSAAPALQTPAGKQTISKKTLLFFYESGCNSCENEIHQLMGNYEIVKNHGYEIISVAADLTKDAGDGHDHQFPWTAQLCDYKGFTGPNFKSYAIIGTPTFFVINEQGKITGRYARLIDTGVLDNPYTMTKN